MYQFFLYQIIKLLYVYYRLYLIRFINYIIGLYLLNYYLNTVEYLITELIILSCIMKCEF